MPRSTAKSKSNIGNLKTCNVSNKLSPKNNGRKDKCLKNDLISDTPKETVIEEVFHRKSERRRIARDIFLVFEEESSSKRKTRSNKKQAKPKFGHLKVEDSVRPKALLRDIKNEPKCYLNESSVIVNAKLATDVQILKNKSNILKVKKEGKAFESETSKCKTSNSRYINNSNNIDSIKLSTVDSQSCTLGNDANIVAKINPIFLWVKQDDTRIVEVRCEDYDKRNRIRITKTSSGWLAIPRSDPTTSRVLKFNPTPLMKVKRENNIFETNDIVHSKHESNSDVNRIDKQIDCRLNGIDTVCNPLALKNIKSKTKVKKSKKLQKSQPEASLMKCKSVPIANHNTMVYSETKETDVGEFNITSSSINVFPKQANLEIKSKIDEEIIKINSHTLDADKKLTAQSLEKTTANLEINEESNHSSSVNDVQQNTKSVEYEKEFSFHLCPKTGLFLPDNASFDVIENDPNKYTKAEDDSKFTRNNFLNCGKGELSTEVEKSRESKTPISDENAESLEAKTKNLKDLLDEADLLQNCDDNANIDADLIDTLVKRSCENNLIHSHDINKDSVEQLHQKIPHATNEIGVQLIADVSDPPKSLSFNEAGEIEGLNGDLFQANNYIESFDKQSPNALSEPQVVLHSTTSVADTFQKSPLSGDIPVVVADINSNKLQTIIEIDDSPKDLSYKKRKQDCIPSESLSQCAVTSSSDVIKSPQKEEPTSLASSSETLKKLILEQFMKLNALTTQHQMEEKDFEAPIRQDISNMKNMYSSKSEHSNGIVETVIIEDDDNDNEYEDGEPFKKRLRFSNHNVVNKNVSKLSMIDKDPDPLTQLRLLIQNTQWKVPDPILVPKDRLSAVLASPAREIPLLITTRPELRLPEAFAYPEIIKNPNILVISMAQLEAILKNEIEVEKSKTSTIMPQDGKQEIYGNRSDCTLTDRINDIQPQSAMQPDQRKLKPNNFLTTANNIHNTTEVTTDAADISETVSERQEYEKILETESSQSPEVNSATMAVLNQMLWLPYFGKISQEIGKSLINAKSLEEKCAGIVPLFSKVSGSSSQDSCKNTARNKTSMQSSPITGSQSIQKQFKTSEELSLFKKIVKHQMQSVLQLNQRKSDLSQITSPVSLDKEALLIEKPKSLSNLMEQGKESNIFSPKQKTASMYTNRDISCSSNVSVLEKSYNLRSSVAGRHCVESKQYSNNNQRQITNNKPRLTCKSLSNLLDPEHGMNFSNPSASYAQSLSTDFLKNVNDIKISAGWKADDNVLEENGQFFGNTCNLSGTPRSFKHGTGKPSSDLARKRDKVFDNNPSNNNAPALPADTNAPLWHPLFGSNSKTSYSSPWQWTTVTASGE